MKASKGSNHHSYQFPRSTFHASYCLPSIVHSFTKFPTSEFVHVQSEVCKTTLGKRQNLCLYLAIVLILCFVVKHTHTIYKCNRLVLWTWCVDACL